MSPRQEQQGVEKGPDAFRTISEVAEDLDLPQHVLRFWETRFPQIRPLKRGGGRRYYRPDDVELLRGIRHLLYGEGYTIRGVQRILKEEGPRHVQAIWRDVEADDQAIAELDRREERGARAPAPPPLDESPDTAPPARAPEPEAPRGGTLGGILNLLPGRQRDPAEDAPARRARRRPDGEPDHLDLPLLADLEPPARPSRHEPLRRKEPPQIEVAPPPFERTVPDRRDPGNHLPEPVPVERSPIEPHPTETNQPEARASFPFRPVVSGPAAHIPEDELNFVPPPFQATSAAVPPAVPTTPRAGGVQSDEAPARARLSRDDIQRLQAALYELQDCQRLLDAARDRSG
ncbi:MerR family transcriptional regulator [Ancylobacter dichloromethanicus]|nr:MerR family transcriptional regulator [Ancylobacter dichloromethanicus]